MTQREKTQLLEENKRYILEEIKNRRKTRIELADELGVNRRSLYRAIKRWEEGREPYKQYTPEEERQRLSLGLPVVYVPTPSPKPPVFMHRPDTRETLYWLGMLATDGNLFRKENRRKYTVSNISKITLALTDKDVIEKFASYCDNPSTNITVKKHDNPNWNDLYIYSLLISEEEANWLESLGITPNKSKTMKVSDKLMDSRDFLRGVIDGDGHFYIRDRGKKGKEHQIGISTGSEYFANQVVNTFQRLFSDGKVNQDKRGTYRVYTNKKQTLYDALTYLYSDAPENLRMERKYENAMRILNEATF